MYKNLFCRFYYTFRTIYKIHGQFKSKIFFSLYEHFSNIVCTMKYFQCRTLIINSSDFKFRNFYVNPMPLIILTLWIMLHNGNIHEIEYQSETLMTFSSMLIYYNRRLKIKWIGISFTLTWFKLTLPFDGRACIYIQKKKLWMRFDIMSSRIFLR